MLCFVRLLNIFSRFKVRNGSTSLCFIFQHDFILSAVMPYFLAISGGWVYNFVTAAFAMSVPLGSTKIVTND